MKSNLWLTLVMVVTLSSYGFSQTRLVGTNLASITDYNEEFIFKDVFKASREWIPFDASGTGSWDSGVTIPLRSDGYPIEIPYDNGVNPPQAIRSLILWDMAPESFVPIGNFTLKSEGTGQIRLKFGATGTFTSPGTYTFIPTAGSISVEILQSDVNDPVHNIEIILPGFAANYQSAPFHPDYLNFIADFKVLRFMDLMRTNGSPVQTWADRTPVDYYTQTLPTGIAYEHIIELCNTAQKDPWICIPHQADDNYITQLAQLLKNNLNPGLTIYLEYSNEVWNSSFPQNGYAAVTGNALGYTGQPWEQAWKYTAKRSADIFYLFEQVFGVNSPRLVKIIASQAVNSWVTNFIISRFEEPLYNPYGVSADAISIAPYFGHGIGDEIGNNGQIGTITVDEILDLLVNSMQTDAFDAITATLSVANMHGLDLNTYEGGQHLVAYTYQNNTTLTQKLKDANRNDRMEDIYCEYLDFWYNTVGDDGLFVNFSSQGSYSKYGSWGIKEYQGQPAIEAPKYRAFQNCVLSILPLNWLDFTAKRQQDRTVLLEWSTSGEYNTDILLVERAEANEAFKPIGQILSSGQNSARADYEYLDKNPAEGINYYRVKQVDLDGRFAYSNIRSVDFGNVDFERLKFFPNPVEDRARILLPGKQSAEKINFYDSNGRCMMSFNLPEQYLDLTPLSSGMYMAEVITTHGIYFQKVIKR